MSTLETNLIQPATGTALTVGASGDTITIPSGATITNSGTATGFGGGKVLQVVQAKLETEASTASTSFVSTGLTAAITCSATSSKVMLIVAAPIYNNTADKYYYGTVYRAANIANTAFIIARNNGSAIGTNAAINYLDSPSSTSELTYTYYHKVDSGATGYISINDYTSTITLLEIGA